ncbi:hypothetical protein [Jeongeupia chitinilytica]|uniref:Amino acid transport protein n=1 Tax=Jeongeupia chitinilytica TaxID=1041641 RepID=A0ABQ3H227_9NEIS|nr:hypothetical protein [Jeongeupia chitinilytica]GHD64718.1 hypothetical protein GCM10007350_24350 [Jeongeupia chitinilytica]
MPTPAVLFASIFFGLIGLVAFRYGRRETRFEPMLIGIALMVYPYFVPQTWLLYLIGVGLSALFYVRR